MTTNLLGSQLITFPTRYQTKGNITKPSLPAVAKWNQLKRSIPSHANQGVAILCGERSGITVLDFDNDAAYEDFMHSFIDLETFTVKTPRGYHLYFRYCPDLSTSHFEGLDILNNSAFVIAPGNHQIINSKRVYYQIANHASKAQLDNEIISYLLHLGGKHRVTQTQNPLQQLSRGERFFPLCDLSLLEEALDKLVAVVDSREWFKITSAIKSMLWNNTDGLIQIWEEWSRKGDKYHKEENMRILERLTPVVPANYIFKQAKMKFRTQETRIDEVRRMQFSGNEFNSQYLTHFFDVRQPLQTDLAVKSGTKGC